MRAQETDTHRHYAVQGTAGQVYVVPTSYAASGNPARGGAFADF